MEHYIFYAYFSYEFIIRFNLLCFNFILIVLEIPCSSGKQEESRVEENVDKV